MEKSLDLPSNCDVVYTFILREIKQVSGAES